MKSKSSEDVHVRISRGARHKIKVAAAKRGVSFKQIVEEMAAKV